MLGDVMGALAALALTAATTHSLVYFSLAWGDTCWPIPRGIASDLVK